MSSEVNGVNVSADNVFVCIKITFWVRVSRPHQVTAPTTLKLPPLWTSRPSLEKILDPPLSIIQFQFAAVWPLLSVCLHHWALPSLFISLGAAMLVYISSLTVTTVAPPNGSPGTTASTASGPSAITAKTSVSFSATHVGVLISHSLTLARTGVGWCNPPPPEVFRG